MSNVSTYSVRYTPRQNAKTWGNRFTSRFLEPGLISYEDVGGDVELLRKETLDRYAETFVGRPSIVNHSRVTPMTMEGKAVGYITRVWFEPRDNWYYCEGIITDDRAKQLIKDGWSVSCSYHVTATDETPGVYHAIPYRREITAFDGEHLAIVENPRYEGATIRLNAKPKENTVNLFKLFRKTAAPASTKQEPKPEERENALSAETVIEVGENKTATLGELVERFNSKPAESEELSPESTIEVAPGKLVTIGQLVARWNEVKPFAHEHVKRNENESDEDYKNRCHAYDEAAKKTHDNAAGVQSFKVLANAPKVAEAVAVSAVRANSSGSLQDRIARGKARYGVAVGKN